MDNKTKENLRMQLMMIAVDKQLSQENLNNPDPAGGRVDVLTGRVIQYVDNLVNSFEND